MDQIASNTEWKAWAKNDPLYGVATSPGKDKRGPSPWTEEEFYETGRADWSLFHPKWQAYGVDYRSCVEIGCGPGRITSQLANNFEIVHGLDISEDMVAYARRVVDRPNVRFHVTHGVNIPLPDESVSAAFSCHVFQHFDSLSVAREYFNEISRVTCPGGTIMIHLPVYSWPNGARIFEMIHSLRKACSDVKASINRALLKKGIFRPIMRTLFYPCDWFFAEMPKLQFERIEICLVQPRVPFLFATKSGG